MDNQYNIQDIIPPQAAVEYFGGTAVGEYHNFYSCRLYGVPSTATVYRGWIGCVEVTLLLSKSCVCMQAVLNLFIEHVCMLRYGCFCFIAIIIFHLLGITGSYYADFNTGNILGTLQLRTCTAATRHREGLQHDEVKLICKRYRVLIIPLSLSYIIIIPALEWDQFMDASLHLHYQRMPNCQECGIGWILQSMLDGGMFLT